MKKVQNNFKGKIITNSIYACLLTVLITLSIFNISFFFFFKPQTSYIIVNPLEKQITFWQTFLDSHPTYFSGWIQLAKLELKNGNVVGADIALSEAFKINPNSNEIKVIENELRN